MDTLLKVVSRLAGLLEQYDSAQASLGNMEMQKEVLVRIPGSDNKDLDSAKTHTNKAIDQLREQCSAAERALTDITGLSPNELREMIQAIKVTLERVGDISLEYKRMKVSFEIIVNADAFDTEEESDGSRKSFEAQLTNLKKLQETGLIYLTNLVDSCINKRAIVGATDSVLSNLKDRSLIVGE